MFCTKCGEAIPDGSVVCPVCQANLKEENRTEQVLVYASQKVEESVSESPVARKKPSKKVTGIVGVVVAILVIVFAVNEVQKSNLKKELLRDWLDADSSIIKVLDFSNGEVEYRLETGYSWMDTTLGTYDYKVVSGNKIKIKRYSDNYETFTIEFNDEKSMMMVTPAITSTDTKENWFNIDEVKFMAQ